ncbi:toll/interleukin-1 receptor domain-containing protein [Cyclobacterium jeungdonense]|uniref:Toll/interleukin-1 receptor domain-containing protein n=1 Tax=Cyclobacterium jeungdonense TaxID=708087 RepID=A0ABT8C816_9BACT|nr:toll/interleukin-1 receptor domain-containing protein [Cyclobacterium jeungdonense]MDN3688670.1 toll/interleukin-1 receptor domain-containing protein [Cyclobacterium jeungdonense]
MNKSTIFISHISEEKEIANNLKSFIETRFLKTVDVFSSSHDESLKLGDDWMDTIKKSMKNCKLIIILCSPISISRPWINFEAGAGWIRNLPVIPLCHSGLTPGKLPVPLNSFQGGLINNEDDVSKLFKKIAEILGIEKPNSSNNSFFSEIKNFELKIKNSEILKDSRFIKNLLIRQIEILKYSIFYSTIEYGEKNTLNLRNEDIGNHEFTFNEIYHLFDFSMLVFVSNKRIFEVFHDTIHELSENIKFLLLYNRIDIPPKIKELLNIFLYSKFQVDNWYDQINFIANKESDSYIQLAIKLIKQEPLPQTKKESNIINYFIQYYESLIYFKKWIVDFEIEINSIINEDK